MKYALPKTLWIDLIDSCNNNCIWCYVKDSVNNAKGTEIDISFINNKIKIFKEIGIKNIILIGGEPTLYSNLFRLIKLLGSHDMKISLVTNGRVFSDMNFAKNCIDLGLKNITFSFHGFSEENYYKNTKKKDVFKDVLLGFENLTQMGYKPNANIVLSRLSFQYSSEIIAFINDTLKLKHIAFNVASPAVEYEKVDDSFVLSFEESAKHIVEIFNLSRKVGIKSTFQLNIPFCSFHKNDLKMLLNANAFITGCHVRYGGGLVLKHNKSLAICNHLLSYELITENRINEVLDSKVSFERFWFSDLMSDIRKKLNFYPYKKCSSCEYWNNCGGGCLVNYSSKKMLNYGKVN